MTDAMPPVGAEAANPDILTVTQAELSSVVVLTRILGEAGLVATEPLDRNGITNRISALAIVRVMAETGDPQVLADGELTMAMVGHDMGDPVALNGVVARLGSWLHQNRTILRGQLALEAVHKPSDKQSADDPQEQGRLEFAGEPLRMSAAEQELVRTMLHDSLRESAMFNSNVVAFLKSYFSIDQEAGLGISPMQLENILTIVLDLFSRTSYGRQYAQGDELQTSIGTVLGSLYVSGNNADIARYYGLNRHPTRVSRRKDQFYRFFMDTMSGERRLQILQAAGVELTPDASNELAARPSRYDSMYGDNRRRQAVTPEPVATPEPSQTTVYETVDLMPFDQPTTTAQANDATEVSGPEPVSIEGDLATIREARTRVRAVLESSLEQETHTIAGLRVRLHRAAETAVASQEASIIALKEALQSAAGSTEGEQAGQEAAPRPEAVGQVPDGQQKTLLELFQESSPDEQLSPDVASRLGNLYTRYSLGLSSEQRDILRRLLGLGRSRYHTSFTGERGSLGSTAIGQGRPLTLMQIWGVSSYRGLTHPQLAALVEGAIESLQAQAAYAKKTTEDSK